MSNEPGVQNPQMLDLVSQDPESGEFILIMVETRGWDGSIERIRQLQQKINRYVAFALEGEMVRKFPDSIEKPVRIQLSCYHTPDERTLLFLNNAASKLREEGISFSIKQI